MGNTGKREGRLTAFKLHSAGLNVHGEILQVHRAGQDESQSETERETERARVRDGEREGE